MRVFALSDIHVDYEPNVQWIADLSSADYQEDVLILAGDVSDSLERLDWTLRALVARFKTVLFVPGNHELWVIRDTGHKSSLQKFAAVRAVVENAGGSMQAWRSSELAIVPLLGWYDYSFGQLSEYLLEAWMDFRACRWPAEFEPEQVAAHFAGLNEPQPDFGAATVISFSHFLPRIDLMPDYISQQNRRLYPVLGGVRLEQQLRALRPQIHVYGHSHVNRRVCLDGVTYINNAFGYPQETGITAKQLVCIHEL